MKAYQWRRAVLRSKLKPTTRHVLLTLACYMNEEKETAYPSTITLARDTGLSERTVITHLHEARDAGWLEIMKLRARGQGWARHQYRFCDPDVVDVEVTDVLPEDMHEMSPEAEHELPLIPGTEAGSVIKPKKALKEKTQGTELHAQGTEAECNKALKELQSNRTVNSLSKPINKKEESAALQALPAWLPKDAWFAYVDMRNKKRKPMTDYARKLVLTTLQHFHELGHDVAAVLDASTRNSWTDVYAPKEINPLALQSSSGSHHGQHGHHRHAIRYDRSAAAAAIFGTEGDGQVIEVNAVEVSHVA